MVMSSSSDEGESTLTENSMELGVRNASIVKCIRAHGASGNTDM